MKAVNHYMPPCRLLHKDKVSDAKKASNTIPTEEARKKEHKAVEPLPQHTRFDAGDFHD